MVRPTVALGHTLSHVLCVSTPTLGAVLLASAHPGARGRHALCELGPEFHMPLGSCSHTHTPTPPPESSKARWGAQVSTPGKTLRCDRRAVWALGSPASRRPWRVGGGRGREHAQGPPTHSVHKMANATGRMVFILMHRLAVACTWPDSPAGQALS